MALVLTSCREVQQEGKPDISAIGSISRALERGGKFSPQDKQTLLAAVNGTEPASFMAVLALSSAYKKSYFSEGELRSVIEKRLYSAEPSIAFHLVELFPVQLPEVVDRKLGQSVLKRRKDLEAGPHVRAHASEITKQEEAFCQSALSAPDEAIRTLALALFASKKGLDSKWVTWIRNQLDVETKRASHGAMPLWQMARRVVSKRNSKNSYH